MGATISYLSLKLSIFPYLLINSGVHIEECTLTDLIQMGGGEDDIIALDFYCYVYGQQIHSSPFALFN